MRSNLWKMAGGAAISAFVICLWAGTARYAMEPWSELVMQQAMKLQWEPPRAGDRLDMDEFRRETAAAVAMLDEMKKKAEPSRHGAGKTRPNQGAT